MTDFAVTLTLPEPLYDRARRLAEEQQVPLEQILVRQLETSLVKLPVLPPEEQAELDALAHLSDQALWTIAREQMPQDDQVRMQILMDRNNMGTISSEDLAELTQRVEDGQRLMLRKAQAMALLTERGHRVRLDDLAHE